MTALFIIKFSSDRIKTIGEVAFLKFPAPYVSVLTKISKCHNIFKFRQLAKTFITFYSNMTTLFIIKFESDQMKIVGGAAF